MPEPSRELSRLLRPESVAVIGATDTPGKPGHRVMENLVGGSARLYPVTPRAETVRGLHAYPAVDRLPEVPDVAVLAVSAAVSVEATAACVAVGVPFVIVLAGGFGEAGEEGLALEHRLREAIDGTATRILGPNTLGVQVTETGFDTVFVEHSTTSLVPAVGLVDRTESAPFPGVALISQSGSVAVEALGAAGVFGLPLRTFVGLGNAVDLKSLDFVEHFAADPATSSLALYLEHLGEGRPLLEAARRAAARIPVFLLKAGRTSAGAAAVASHTGRLAGSDRVVDGALRQYGIQRVVDDEELLDAARIVSYTGLPQGNRVAIVTPAGGYGVMGTDAIETPAGPRTLRLAELSAETEERIRAVSLPFASTHNPVDLTAGASTDAFVTAVKVILEDPGVDIALVYAFFAPTNITRDLVERLAALARTQSKPMIVFAHAGKETATYCRAFSQAGVAAYPSLARAVRATRILVERAGVATRNWTATSTPASGRAEEWLAALGNGGLPTEADAKTLLDAYGVTTPRRFLSEGARNAPKSSEAAPGFPGPYAVKVASAELLHKTEAGALRLNVTQDTLPAILEGLRTAFPGEVLLIEKMVDNVEVELIAGVTVDSDLGPALMLGAGGILTELYADVTFRLLPTSREDIAEMTDELTVSPLLRGFRGFRADRHALIDTLSGICALVADLGDRIGELDVNPLCYAEGRWIALDAKLILASERKEDK